MKSNKEITDILENIDIEIDNLLQEQYIVFNHLKFRFSTDKQDSRASRKMIKDMNDISAKIEELKKMKSIYINVM